MIEDYPLSGVGLGNWKIVIPAYGTEGLDSATGKRNFIRPHNDYLWVLAESGIPGFLLYLSIFGIALFYAFRIFFHSQEASARFMAVLMAFGLTEYLIFSTFTFSRERIVHSTLLMLMLGALTALYHRSFPLKTTVSKSYSTPVLFMILLVSGVCAGSGYWRLNSEIHTFKAESPRIQNQPQAQIRAFDRAETFLYKIDPVANPLSLRRGEAYLALSRPDKAFEEFLKAYRVHPNNILVLWNLAAMYDRRKNPEKSEEFFLKVLAISPRLEGALLNLTAVYIKAGKYEAAYEVIQRCHPESRNPKVAQYRGLIEGKLRE
jgi:tetratricopeptide (TPR) repeat protein